MIIEVKTRSYTRLKLWIDELPDCQVQSSQVIKQSFSVISNRVVTKRMAAVEFAFPGGITYSGLLGGALEPSSNNVFELNIAVSDDESRPITWSLLTIYDNPFVSIPNWAIPYIVDGIEMNTELYIPSVLNITHGFSSHVGSAPVLYRGLANMLIYVLSSEQLDMFEIQRRTRLIE